MNDWLNEWLNKIVGIFFSLHEDDDGDGDDDENMARG